MMMHEIKFFLSEGLRRQRGVTNDPVLHKKKANSKGAVGDVMRYVTKQEFVILFTVDEGVL